MPDSEYECYVHFDLVSWHGVTNERWVLPIAQIAPTERQAAERASHTVKRTLVPEATVIKVDVAETENVATYELSELGQSPHVL